MAQAPLYGSHRGVEWRASIGKLDASDEGLAVDTLGEARYSHKLLVPARGKGTAWVAVTVKCRLIACCIRPAWSGCMLHLAGGTGAPQPPTRVAQVRQL